MELRAYSSNGKEHLSSNPRRRSQQEFGSRPVPNLLNQKKAQEHKENQSKVMEVGGYNASGKEHLFSNPRRRHSQKFDSRPTLLLNQNKAPEHKPSQSEAVAAAKSSRPLWDCGSSLYDSVELDSFKRQLDSAISSRTMSMPHLSDRRVAPPPQPAITATNKKPSSNNKLSRSIHKLLRSLFKPNSKPSNNSSGVVLRVQDQQANIKDGFYVVYDKTGALTTIPEVVPHEFDFDGLSTLSPETGALVRRTGSGRFTTSSTSNIGISCA